MGQCIEGKQEQYDMCEVYLCTAHYHLLDCVGEERAAASEICFWNNEVDTNTWFCPCSHPSDKQGDQDMVSVNFQQEGRARKQSHCYPVPHLTVSSCASFHGLPLIFTRLSDESVESIWQALTSESQELTPTTWPPGPSEESVGL